MTRQRTVLIVIAVPAVVSLAVTLLVLTIWDRQQEPRYIMLPTYSNTAQIPPVATLPAAASGDTSAAPSGGDTGGAATEAAQAGCENPVHIVQGGETLGVIAAQYNVNVDQVAEMNRQIDPNFSADFLSIGQQIVIPICGIPPTAAPTDTEVPTREVLTPIATSTPPPPGVVIVKVARVLNPGDVTTEAVEIINEGSSVARLEGWTLRNGEGAVYTFPALNLFPQGAVTVHTGVGEDSAIDVYWGRDKAAWQVGGTAQLLNADGELQNEFDIVGP